MEKVAKLILLVLEYSLVPKVHERSRKKLAQWKAWRPIFWNIDTDKDRDYVFESKSHVLRDINPATEAEGVDISRKMLTGKELIPAL